LQKEDYDEEIYYKLSPLSQQKYFIRFFEDSD